MKIAHFLNHILLPLLHFLALFAALQNLRCNFPGNPASVMFSRESVITLLLRVLRPRYVATVSLWSLSGDCIIRHLKRY